MQRNVILLLRRILSFNISVQLNLFFLKAVTLSVSFQMLRDKK